ncbi:hypothetical protein YDYSY3_28020 [Paenibacillus chitinolyticus]|nr:hypothetical protein YDYSY3_28020 [Paenibacillus chitinolyticus]
MDTKEMLRKFEETVSGYIRELDGVSLEQLLWKPAEDEWSLGQMHVHLIHSAQFMHLRNVALCLAPNGNPAVSSTGKTKPGEEVFGAGSFPSDRVQVPPSPQYTPPQPEGKEQLVDGLRGTVRRMTEIERAVAAAFDPVAQAISEPGKDTAFELVRNTVVHPRFGGLNALESGPESGKLRYWIGVVSASHVQRGVQGGFAQMCHGKSAPLRRMQPGDWLVYYSPRTEMGGGEPLQAFTAIGRVADDRVYEYAMSATFVPFRRNIEYVPCREARIVDLLDRLYITRGKRNWGYPFRTGHFEIDREDFLTIAEAMHANFG